MSGHSFYLNGDTKAGSVSIATTATGNVDFGANNGFDTFWVMPRGDATFTVAVSDTQNSVLASVSATAAAGAVISMPAFGRLVLTRKRGQYVNIKVLSGSTVVFDIDAGNSPA